MSKSKQYGIASSIDASMWDGPFRSLRDAIFACQREYTASGYGYPGAICDIEYLSPEDYVNAVDTDWMLEQMGELASDNVVCGAIYGVDDIEPLFETKRGAEEALRESLEKWAAEYVKTVAWEARNIRTLQAAEAELAAGDAA